MAWVNKAKNEQITDVKTLIPYHEKSLVTPFIFLSFIIFSFFSFLFFIFTRWKKEA